MRGNRVNQMLIGGGHLDQLSSDLNAFIIPKIKNREENFLFFLLEKVTV